MSTEFVGAPARVLSAGAGFTALPSKKWNRGRMTRAASLGELAGAWLARWAVADKKTWPLQSWVSRCSGPVTRSKTGHRVTGEIEIERSSARSGFGIRLTDRRSLSMPQIELADENEERTGALCPNFSLCPAVPQDFRGADGGSRDCNGLIPLEFWWAHKGSNLGPLPCEGNALPLSYAPGNVVLRQRPAGQARK
jgi:hypothetical protein